MEDFDTVDETQPLILSSTTLSLQHQHQQQQRHHQQHQHQTWSKRTAATGGAHVLWHCFIMCMVLLLVLIFCKIRKCIAITALVSPLDQDTSLGYLFMNHIWLMNNVHHLGFATTARSIVTMFVVLQEDFVFVALVLMILSLPPLIARAPDHQMSWYPKSFPFSATDDCEGRSARTTTTFPWTIYLFLCHLILSVIFALVLLDNALFVSTGDTLTFDFLLSLTNPDHSLHSMLLECIGGLSVRLAAVCPSPLTLIVLMLFLFAFNFLPGIILSLFPNLALAQFYFARLVHVIVVFVVVSVSIHLVSNHVLVPWVVHDTVQPLHITVNQYLDVSLSGLQSNVVLDLFSQLCRGLGDVSRSPIIPSLLPNLAPPPLFEIPNFTSPEFKNSSSIIQHIQLILDDIQIPPVSTDDNTNTNNNSSSSNSNNPADIKGPTTPPIMLFIWEGARWDLVPNAQTTPFTASLGSLLGDVVTFTSMYPTLPDSRAALSELLCGIIPPIPSTPGAHLPFTHLDIFSSVCLPSLLRRGLGYRSVYVSTATLFDPWARFTTTGSNATASRLEFDAVVQLHDSELPVREAVGSREALFTRMDHLIEATKQALKRQNSILNDQELNSKSGANTTDSTVSDGSSFRGDNNNNNNNNNNGDDDEDEAPVLLIVSATASHAPHTSYFPLNQSNSANMQSSDFDNYLQSLSLTDVLLEKFFRAMFGLTSSLATTTTGENGLKGVCGAMGCMQDALVAVVGDHGLGFGAHSHYGEGSCVFSECAQAFNLIYRSHLYTRVSENQISTCPAPFPPSAFAHSSPRLTSNTDPSLKKNDHPISEVQCMLRDTPCEPLRVGGIRHLSDVYATVLDELNVTLPSQPSPLHTSLSLTSTCGHQYVFVYSAINSNSFAVHSNSTSVECIFDIHSGVHLYDLNTDPQEKANNHVVSVSVPTHLPNRWHWLALQFRAIVWSTYDTLQPAKTVVDQQTARVQRRRLDRLCEIARRPWLHAKRRNAHVQIEDSIEGEGRYGDEVFD